MLKTPPLRDNHLNDYSPPSNRDFMDDNYQIFNRFQLEVNMGKSAAVKIFDEKTYKKNTVAEILTEKEIETLINNCKRHRDRAIQNFLFKQSEKP